MSGSACTPALTTSSSTSALFGTWSSEHRSSLNSLASLSVPPSTSQEDTLNAAVKDIQDMTQCLQDQIRNLSSSSNEISANQETILALNAEIEKEEANAAIARDRVAYIRDPATSVSNYESWFPMGRPMKILSMIAILGVTLFVSIFALLIALSVVGVDVSVFTQPSIRTGYGYGWTDWIYSQFTPAFWIMLIILLSIVAVYVNRKAPL